MRFLRSIFLALMALGVASTALALTINADFSRDITGQNPGTPNPASMLYASTGPSGDTNTLWNDLKIVLPTTGDDGTASILHPVTFSNLTASDGSVTTVDVTLTSGFYRAFNSTGGTVNNLQRDWIFARNGTTAVITLSGLDPAKAYDLYLIGGSSFPTTYTVNGMAKAVTVASSSTGTWTSGVYFNSYTGLTPDGSGNIVVSIRDTAGVGNGVIAGLQLYTASAPPPAVNFLYAASATSTSGQFSASYPPSNLMNAGFTSPANTISTATDYLAAGNNYATVSDTTANFDLTFNFASSTDVDGFHVWNYAFRNGAVNTSPISGVNAYILTFYTGTGATGSVIGSVYSGNLAAAIFGAANPAQSVYFGTTYTAARSVVMRVLSNHGSATFTGLNELAFNGIGDGAPFISNFASSAPFVQRPATPTLSWSVGGPVTSLTISPDIGDVLPLTTGGSGSVSVSPLGEQTYTLTLNGSVTQTLSVVGLPLKEKLHLYLMIGQSNMQGAGTPYNATTDAAVPRVVKFGSRNGMESLWVKGGHPLTSLDSNGGSVGMGVEFGKAMLAAHSDPEVVIGVINHAMGASAIQWWAPGVIDNQHFNPVTNQNYYLYDEAVQRVTAASTYGVLKGVLWHQGEYNSVSNTNPDSDPDGYAARLQTLVSNLRTSFANPTLPFVCGKLVPTSWLDDEGNTVNYTGLTFRAAVETALTDLPNQRAHTFCVNNDGLRGIIGNLIHFDSPSQRLLGQRYAAGMIGLQTPYDLALSASSLAEGNAAGAVVANMAGFDVEPEPTFTFSLISGAGSEDNAAFTVNGVALQLNASADFETKPSYAIRLRATNLAGLFYEKSFTINVTDVVETPADTWRQTYFGTTSNTGNAADTADADSDGIANLVEFAFGTHPVAGSSGTTALRYTGTLAGGGTIAATGQPITYIETTGDFHAVYARRKDYAAAGLSFAVEFSDDLAGWETSAATPALLADDGTLQIVTVPFPALLLNGRKPNFFRISVTAN